MKPCLSSLTETCGDVHEAKLQEELANGRFRGVSSTNGPLRDHEMAVLREPLDHYFRRKYPLHQDVAGQISAWIASAHDQLPAHHDGTKSMVPGELENPASIGPEKNIVFGPKLVGRFTRSCYAEMTAPAKALKGSDESATVTFRCCRDLFRPWAKNSSNSKGLCLLTITRVFRATFLRSSSWHRLMMKSWCPGCYAQAKASQRRRLAVSGPPPRCRRG